MGKSTSKRELRNKERQIKRKPLHAPSDSYLLVTDSFEEYEYTFNSIYLAKHIKELRQKENISQYELALRIGAEKEQIKLIETGNYVFPLSVYNYMAHIVFRVSLSFLLTGEENSGRYIGSEEDEKPQIGPRNKTPQQSEPELTPEEEVDEFLNGQRDFADLSPEAETFFFEEIDDD